MKNYEYTCGIDYDFTSSINDNPDAINNNIKILGVYPQSEIEAVLVNNSNNMFTSFVISQTLEVPADSPKIKEIVSVFSCIDIISQSVIKTPTVTGYYKNGVDILGKEISNSECTNLTGKKLIIELIVTDRISYIADGGNNSVSVLDFKYPYSTYMIIDKDIPVLECLKLDSYIINSCCLKLSQDAIYKSSVVFINVN